MNQVANDGPLTDSFGRRHTFLRISLIEQCNLRCTYCMPAEGVPLSPKSHVMRAAEIEAIAACFVSLGVQKIRLTGGEPLLRKDFPAIITRLSALPVKLSLTTNAVLVDRHIDLLLTQGLTHINVSLDSLQSQKFSLITKRDQFQRTYTNLMRLIQAGFEVKVNVVLLKDFNEDEIIDFIDLSCQHPIEVRFIEFMPFRGNKWDRSQLISQQEILAKVAHHYGPEAVTALPTAPNFTAQIYQVPGAKGQFGIISTMTNPFCDSCNRIRLTADGKLKNCLFSSRETDLLSTYRQGGDLIPLIQHSLWHKHATRAGMDSLTDIANPELHGRNRSMITIGG